MSNTDTGKIVLGKKAYVKEPEIIDDTRGKAEGSVSIINRRVVSSPQNVTVYVRVNFERQKKKEAYRKINKILGEN